MNPKTKGIIYFKNGSKRLQDEFVALVGNNQGLHELIVDTCAYCKAEFNKDIVITMLYRTQEEQDQLYKDSAKYKEKKFTSPHQYHHAVDLRSSVFTRPEIDKLVDYLNKVYNKTNYYKWTAKCHDIDGDGPQAEHFHIQYIKR